jgi:hypothetical protein
MHQLIAKLLQKSDSKTLAEERCQTYVYNIVLGQSEREIVPSLSQPVLNHLS